MSQNLLPLYRNKTHQNVNSNSKKRDTTVCTMNLTKFCYGENDVKYFRSNVCINCYNLRQTVFHRKKNKKTYHNFK